MGCCKTTSGRFSILAFTTNGMILENSIIIVGPICSGKTTLAKMLSHTFSIPIASFGIYLRTLYNIQGDSSEDRKALQDKGEHLVKTDSIGFLRAVVSHSPKSSQLIFDGVRHIQILEGIEKISIKCQSVYFEVPFGQRLKRYMKRENISDFKTGEIEFDKAIRHPVEADIPLLKKKCNHILVTSGSIESDFVCLKNYLLLK